MRCGLEINTDEYTVTLTDFLTTLSDIQHRLTRLEGQSKLHDAMDNLEDLLRQEHDTHIQHIDRLLNLQGHMRCCPDQPRYLITTGEKEALDYAIQQLKRTMT